MSSDLGSANPFRRSTPTHSEAAAPRYELPASRLGHGIRKIVFKPSAVSKGVRVAPSPVLDPLDESLFNHQSKPSSGDGQRSSFLFPSASNSIVSSESANNDPFESDASGDIASAVDEEALQSPKISRSINPELDAPCISSSSNPFRKSNTDRIPTVRKNIVTEQMNIDAEAALADKGPLMTKKVARESLDVESFKRLMMTGDSSKRPPVTTKFPPTHTNLDVLTSSPEETGIAIQLLPAARIPLTEDSFEKSGEVPVSDDAYCQMAFDEDCSDKRDKSLPPKARHIKLTQGIISHQYSPQRQRDKHALDHSSQDAQENDHGIPSPCDPISSNDLNKVLPNPPLSDHRDTYKLREHENTEGHDDIINAMISPSLQSDRRRPPTPPVARRHSQLSVRSSKSSRTDPLIDTLQRDVDHEDQRLPKVTGLAKPFRRHTSGNGKTSSSVSNLLGPSPVFGAVGTIPRDNTSSSDARSIPPAPPPARTPSSASSKRRSGNLSGASMDKSSMTSPLSMAQPPPLPPPRRHRTSSRSSLDSPVPSHAKRPMRVSSDGARILGSTIDLHSETQQAAVSSASKDPNDILADISALKREVDELRGKFEKEP